MFLAIELFAVLLLIAIGEGVLEVAPHAARRVLVTLAAWVFAFAVGAAILSVRRVAADVVAIGLALLAGYILWWIGAGIVRHFRGPVFFEPPKAGELGELAQQASGLPARDCRKIARRLLQKFDGSVALLGLLSLSGSGEGGAEEFERAWNAASEKSLAQAARNPPSAGARKEQPAVRRAGALPVRKGIRRARPRAVGGEGAPGARGAGRGGRAARAVGQGKKGSAAVRPRGAAEKRPG